MRASDDGRHGFNADNFGDNHRVQIKVCARRCFSSRVLHFLSRHGLHGCLSSFFLLAALQLALTFHHAMHGVGLNFTAVWARGLLFFGARRPRSLAAGWQAAIGMTVMALTDIYLTTSGLATPIAISMSSATSSHLGGGTRRTFAWPAAHFCARRDRAARRGRCADLGNGLLSAHQLRRVGLECRSLPYPHTAYGLGLCLRGGLAVLCT